MLEAESKQAADFAKHFGAKPSGHGGGDSSDDDDDMGPQPLLQAAGAAGQVDGAKGINYGGAMRPGEGAAIAQYVQQNKRIPRRGEVGWQGDKIERLEKAGYVMSGSRHKRMNAIRLRKENQVYTAEEKRALALFNWEEKQQKEKELLNSFTQLISQKNEDMARAK